MEKDRQTEAADYKEMSEVIKDSAIKLFGQTIALPAYKLVSDASLSEHRHSSTSQDTKVCRFLSRMYMCVFSSLVGFNS